MTMITESTDKYPALVKELGEERSGDASFGFWLYLLSDGVIFSMLFTAYMVLVPNTVGKAGPHDLYTMSRTVFETVALLLSSITFGMASIAAIQKNVGKTINWLLVSAALAIVFLYFEIGEFRELAGRGATPQVSAYLSSFFALVGTHGLHVTAGLIWLATMIVQIKTHGLTDAVQSRLTRLGIFWHFLDVIWIGIFSIVYLPGLM